MNIQLGVGDIGVQRYIKIQKEAVPRCMRNFMIEFYRQCTISTPVDTGRARWGWNCTITTPSFDVPPEGAYNVDAGRAVNTFTVSAVTGNDTLYVANAVPYIGKLNEGWSKQAPARFVELAFDYAYKKLEKFISVRGYALEP